MPAAADIPAPCEVPSGSKADGDPEADGTESAVSWNVCPAREEVLSGPVVADSLQGVPTGQSCDDKTVPDDDGDLDLSAVAGDGDGEVLSSPSEDDHEEVLS